MMKIKQLNTLCSLAFVGAMAVGLCSCQQEENTTPDGPGIAVSVSDGGYTGNAVSYDKDTLRELPQTRSTENGYKTNFTAGDQIGFYSVKNNALVAENVCLTLTGGVWTPPAGVKLTSAADRFFVYYPYQSSIASVTATATTADAFFANLIAAWQPASDQSTQVKYTAQDLMTGSGTLGSTPTNGAFPLTVTLSHKMSLAVISLPAGATDVSFNGFTPYSYSGSFRYLMKPATSNTLKGWFSNLGRAREYTFPANIAGGSYKTYTVNGYVLPKIGDYYYSDETYSTVRNTGKTCIGLVFWVDGSGGGKIMSLDEPVANWNGGGNPLGSLAWSWINTMKIETHDEDNGATNMATLKAWLAANSKTLADFPAFKWCDSKGTGWYLPAQNELLAIYNAWGTVNDALGSTYTKFGLNIGPNVAVYWTSNETWGSLAEEAANGRKGNDDRFRVYDKYYTLRVRAVRAF